MNRNQPSGVPIYIVILFLVCLTVLTGTGLADYHNLWVLKQGNDWMARSWNLKNELINLNLRIIELEDNLRAYFMSRNPAYLESWHALSDKMVSEFAILETLIQDNPTQINNLMQLRSLYDRKIKAFEDDIALFKNNELHEAAMIARLNESRQITERIHSLEFIMQDEESASLTQRRNHFLHKYKETMWIEIVINGMATLILVVFYQMVRSSFIKQSLVEDKLKAANDNLESTVQMRARQLSVLSHHLLKVSEEEKAKLARELHDELGSSLTAISMDISSVKEKLIKTDPALAHQLQRAKQTLVETINLKRRIMENLRPSMLDNLGLAASIQHHCEKLTWISGLKFQIDIEENLDDIGPDQAIALFRIMQEALNNAIKYSQATCVKITLKRQVAGLWLQILDNGIGISKEVFEKPKSYGLLGMRERALLLGGSFSVNQGRDGRGCAIEVHFPFPPLPTGSPH